MCSGPGVAHSIWSWRWGAHCIRSWQRRR
jgi:hypothetical protein